MGSMTDERRKEMEEEMMRFEQEISFPGEEDSPGHKALKPPPAPPKLGTDHSSSKERKPLLSQTPTTEVLQKPPPPPPALAIRPNENRPLVPPPMPPIHGPQMGGPMRFIPHQLQRHPPPRPPRPPLLHMRGPPVFHDPGPMPFPMHGPLLHPHPMALPPMGMPLHMPPGFCPPPPGIAMGPMPNMHVGMPPQPFMHSPMPMPFHEPPAPCPTKKEVPIPKESKPEPAIASAPAVYAAPPMKSMSDKIAEVAPVANGQDSPAKVVNVSVPPQVEESKTTKAIEEPMTVVPTPQVTNEPAPTKKEKKKKKPVRMAGGQAWEDNSLIEWDPDDFRIFCGDLGNDVTDEVLIRAFSKYQSFVKAKVIRDKRTNKTKGYGFVSFKDPQDFIKAMREMNGRYVGSRPIKLRKSTWKDRNIEIVRKKQKEKEKLGLL